MKLLGGLTLAALLGAASTVFAQSADLLGNYSQTPAECSSPAEFITISPGQIEGPGFNCGIKNERPAGTGVWVYDAVCEINGKSVSGNMGMGVNMQPGPEYFTMQFPGKDDISFDLHPC